MEFVNEFLPPLKRLNEALSKADTILIGAGAGLSTSAGFTYSGERFEKYFPISAQSTALPICIPAGFIRLKRSKNFGRTGAVTL